MATGKITINVEVTTYFMWLAKTVAAILILSGCNDKKAASIALYFAVVKTKCADKTKWTNLGKFKHEWDKGFKV